MVKTILLITAAPGVIFSAFAALVFLHLLRWLNLIVASWSGPWFPPPPLAPTRRSISLNKEKE